MAPAHRAGAPGDHREPHAHPRAVSLPPAGGSRSLGARGARDRGRRRGRGARHLRSEPAGRSGARDHPVARRGVHRSSRERGLAAWRPPAGGARSGRHGGAGVRLRQRPPVAALPRRGPRAVRGHPHRHGRVPVRQHYAARAAGGGSTARARRGSRVDLRVGIRQRARGSRPPHGRSARHAGGRAGARAGVGDGAAGRAAAAPGHRGRFGWHRRVSAIHRGGAAGPLVPPAGERQGEGQLPLARRRGRGGAGASFRRLAHRFGGGGHRKAAGASLEGSLAEAQAQVLAAARQYLNGR